MLPPSPWAAWRWHLLLLSTRFVRERNLSGWRLHCSARIRVPRHTEHPSVGYHHGMCLHAPKCFVVVEQLQLQLGTLPAPGLKLAQRPAAVARAHLRFPVLARCLCTCLQEQLELGC